MYGVGIQLSPTAAASIQKEYEGECDCNCERFAVPAGMRGLGLEVDGFNGQTMAIGLSERLHDATASAQISFQDNVNRDPHQYDSERLHISMPPTPPHFSDKLYGFSTQGSAGLQPQKPDELVIDPEAFSCDPPSLPQSPSSEIPSGSRSRAATILNRVVPSKLRASLKRRISSSNNVTNQISLVSSTATMPTYSAPGTPPEDIDSFFDQKYAFYTRPATAPDEDSSTRSATEVTLPPLLHPISTFGVEPERFFTSPHQSPRSIGSCNLGDDILPESCISPIAEMITSPLYPPTRSPLMSPSLASASQTSLNMPAIPAYPTHKKVPSIDPATPLAPKKLSSPITLVTANSLADMIEEMNADLAAYDATHARLVESGWSSPQEIRNVELQREDKEKTWKARIAESKRILECMRRTEVKHGAMASVSSFDSFGSLVNSSGPTSHPVSLPLTPISSIDTQSQRSERAMSR
ncbi:hypothetical protein RUND412_008376 [Rhizina undulata]